MLAIKVAAAAAFFLSSSCDAIHPAERIGRPVSDNGVLPRAALKILSLPLVNNNVSGTNPFSFEQESNWI